MYSKSDNKEIMINEKADKVIKNVFKSLLNRYQNNLEKLMKGSEIIFDYVNCNEINVYRGVSYTEFPECMKNKKVVINPINQKGNMYLIYCSSTMKSCKNTKIF